MKYVITPKSARKLSQFLNLWGMTGASKWNSVKTKVHCLHEGFRVEICTKDMDAVKVMDENLFCANGFLADEGWSTKLVNA